MLYLFRFDIVFLITPSSGLSYLSENDKNKTKVSKTIEKTGNKIGTNSKTRILTKTISNRFLLCLTADRKYTFSRK